MGILAGLKSARTLAELGIVGALALALWWEHNSLRIKTLELGVAQGQIAVLAQSIKASNDYIAKQHQKELDFNKKQRKAQSEINQLRSTAQSAVREILNNPIKGTCVAAKEEYIKKLNILRKEGIIR